MVSNVSIQQPLAVASRPKTGTLWGWLPIISILTACGLWAIAFSCVISRQGKPEAVPLYWLGILLIVAPIAIRFSYGIATRRETIGTIIVLGLGLYLVNVFRAPLYFTSFDELLHLRTVADILDTHQLFLPNPMLPVSPLFPGLEIASTALGNLSGANVFLAGFMVVGAARLVMVLALYLIFEKLSGSMRAAALGTLVYTGSSTFVYFDSLFLYESLALPLGTFLLYALLQYSEGAARARFVWGCLAVLAIIVIGITHHATAYFFTVLLFAWACADLYTMLRGGRHAPILFFAIVMLLWNLVWITTIASVTVPYLSPVVEDAINSLQRLLTRQGGDRQILNAGDQGIDYERLVSFASVGFILIGLSVGWWEWWRRQRKNSLSIILALSALIYPALPILRLNSSSWEISNRSAGFVFIGVGLIIGLGLVELRLPKLLDVPRRWFIVPGLIFIVCGGITAGSSRTTRYPGPYAVVADARSVEAQGLSAAEWARKTLGINNRMASDRIQTVLMGSYGQQQMVVNLSEHVSISAIFTRYELRPEEIALINRIRLRYLVVDRRITTGMPLYGYYFESWEQLEYAFELPLNPAVLYKFDHTPNTSRVFDSGGIVIYDIGVLGNVP